MISIIDIFTTTAMNWMQEGSLQIRILSSSLSSIRIRLTHAQSVIQGPKQDLFRALYHMTMHEIFRLAFQARDFIHRGISKFALQSTKATAFPSTRRKYVYPLFCSHDRCQIQSTNSQGTPDTNLQHGTSLFDLAWNCRRLPYLDTSMRNTRRGQIRAFEFDMYVRPQSGSWISRTLGSICAYRKSGPGRRSRFFHEKIRRR